MPSNQTNAVGTVATLSNRDLFCGPANTVDQRAMKLYDMLKNQEAGDNPDAVKDFKDLTGDDIVQDNVVFIINDHIRRIKDCGRIPKNWMERGFNQESPTALKPDSVMKIVEPLFAILQGCFPDHERLKDVAGVRPQWWLNAKYNLKRGLEKQHIRGEDEATMLVTPKAKKSTSKLQSSLSPMARLRCYGGRSNVSPMARVRNHMPHKMFDLD